MKKAVLLIVIMLGAALMLQALPHGWYTCDFENGWPAGWTSSSGLVLDTYAQGLYRSATHSVHNTVKNTEQYITGPLRTYAAGEYITISVWVYNASVGTTDGKIYYSANGTTWTLAQNMNNVNQNGGWTQLVGTFTATTAGNYYVRFGIKNNGNGDAYVDDMQITFNGGGDNTLIVNALDANGQPYSTEIYKNTTDTNYTTNHSFISGLTDNLVGTYTPGPAPDGYYWTTTSYSVADANFNTDNIWTYTITFQLEPTLPVELSSFTVTISANNAVALTWVTQTETNVSGFQLYRHTNDDLATASLLSGFVNATNTSQMQVYVYFDEEDLAAGTYYYWRQSLDFDGGSGFYGPVTVTYNPTGGATPEIPLVTGLREIYPNPFNPKASIPFTLAADSSVRFQIFNSRGQIVREFDLGTKAPGNYTVEWDGTDSLGRILGDGVYCVRMLAGHKSFQRKAILMK